ncbi:MAG: hypothetical protein JST53_15820 [Actinobacteria bacterium]|nr:hypothetical protein [Actinomycetota bacterium]
MSLVTIKRTDALLALCRGVVPRRVETDGNFEDWEIIGPALVAIAADLFEGIMAFPPPRGRVRAEVLARSLAEYAIGFAWLAPEEGRADRIKRFLKDEYREREKTENRLVNEIVPREKPYGPLLQPGGPIPRSLLSEEMKLKIAGLLGDESVVMPPNTLLMAVEADEAWLDRIEWVTKYPFAFIYTTTFGSMSSITHPSITSINRVVTVQGGDTVVGMPAPLESASGPYGGGYLALLSIIWIAAATFGWPDPDEIRAAMNVT